MKKKFIIYGSTLFVVFFLNYSAQAQQQKKPSERSFKAEMEKVNRIQAERNEIIRNAQQPSDSSTVVNTKRTTIGIPIPITPASPASKPSAGKMRQPKKR